MCQQIFVRDESNANLFHNFLFERAEVETVRDVIASVSGDSILMSKQSMHAALLDAARAPRSATGSLRPWPVGTDRWFIFSYYQLHSDMT